MNTYLKSALEAIDHVAPRLTPALIARRQEDGRWSIGDIFEHLTLAFRGNARTLEKVLESGELRARSPVLKATLGRVVVIEFGYFPKVEAPEMTRPSGGILPQDSVTAIRDALSALDDVLARTAARFGEDVPVANHPYFMGLTVHQWRKFHWRHTMHHLAQVERHLTRRPAP